MDFIDESLQAMGILGQTLEDVVEFFTQGVDATDE
jgi:hypothetical protein